MSFILNLVSLLPIQVLVCFHINFSQSYFCFAESSVCVCSVEAVFPLLTESNKPSVSGRVTCHNTEVGNSLERELLLLQYV